MLLRIFFFFIPCLISTYSVAQNDPLTTLQRMEGSWLLDTTSYEATYSPRLQIPVMRMECEMTNPSNGLYCTWTLIRDGQDQGVISGDYFAWDKASGRLILLSTENEVAMVSYGTFPEENVFRYEIKDKDRVVFVAKLTIEADKIILNSVLHDFKGLTGESVMTLNKLK